MVLDILWNMVAFARLYVYAGCFTRDCCRTKVSGVQSSARWLGEAHRIIREELGETEDDWRLTVSNMEHQ